jgi:hypothetical protein
MLYERCGQFHHRAQPERPRGAVGAIPCHGRWIAGTDRNSGPVVSGALPYPVAAHVSRSGHAGTVICAPRSVASPRPTIRRARPRNP